MEINKTNTNKNIVELRSELNAQGVRMENVYVNGEKFCCVGYVSEKDKQACLKAIQTAIDSSKNMYEAMCKLMVNANLTDNNVEPDEQIDVDGETVLISYVNKAMYDIYGEEIVNCSDLQCELPREACKEILIGRARNL